MPLSELAADVDGAAIKMLWYACVNNVPEQRKLHDTTARQFVICRRIYNALMMTRVECALFAMITLFQQLDIMKSS